MLLESNRIINASYAYKNQRKERNTQTKGSKEIGRKGSKEIGESLVPPREEALLSVVHFNILSKRMRSTTCC